MPARALADKLTAMRLTPMIELPPGDALRQAVAEAGAVVALWSPQSAGEAALAAEVELVLKTGKLINARMQNTPAPEAFKAAPTIDLTGWRGEDDFPGWRALAEAIAALTGVAAPAPAASAPRGAFFSPGPAAAAAPRPSAPPPLRPAPPPPPIAPIHQPAPERVYEAPAAQAAADEEPGRRSANLAVIGVVTFLIVAALAIGGYFFYDKMQTAQASDSAWAQLDKTNPAALRAFIESGRAGGLSEAAQTALQSLEAQRLSEARQTDTIESLEAFLHDFPDSRSAVEINGRIAELRQAAADAPPPVDPMSGFTDLQAPPTQAPAPTAPLAAEPPVRAGPLQPGEPAPIGAPQTPTPAPQ